MNACTRLILVSPRSSAVAPPLFLPWRSWSLGVHPSLFSDLAKQTQRESGPTAVRGFEQASLGPVDATGASVGGPKRINLNGELYVPFPGSGNDRTLRLFGYLDAGNVFGEDEKVTFDAFRASAGIGLSWVSPIGPLKLSYGTPIRKEPGDKIQKLQFQIGTAF